MDEWEIKYVSNGDRSDSVMADTLFSALTKWRDDHPLIPGIAVYSIRCKEREGTQSE